MVKLQITNSKSQTNSKLQFQTIDMTLFGIWSLELICHLVLGIWCFLKVQIHILADEKIGIFDDGGRTNPLPTDKGIVSSLVLNG